jgi:hypothetical protein
VEVEEVEEAEEEAEGGVEAPRGRCPLPLVPQQSQLARYSPRDAPLERGPRGRPTRRSKPQLRESGLPHSPSSDQSDSERCDRLCLLLCARQ